MTQDRRKILYIDLDNTMVDFSHRIEGLDPVVVDKYRGRMDEAPGIFALMRSMPRRDRGLHRTVSPFRHVSALDSTLAQPVGLAAQD